MEQRLKSIKGASRSVLRRPQTLYKLQGKFYISQKAKVTEIQFGLAFPLLL